MVAADLSGKRVFLDTAPLIYFMEGHTVFQPVLLRILALHAQGTFSFVSSTITLSEVLVKPFEAAQGELAAKYRKWLINNAGLTLVSLTPAIAEEAAKLRSRYAVKLPDAIQIATALQTHCDAFLTNDIRLKRIEALPVILLSDFTR